MYLTECIFDGDNEFGRGYFAVANSSRMPVAILDAPEAPNVGLITSANSIPILGMFDVVLKCRLNSAVCSGAVDLQ